jgi:uncharacterized membrane protein (UPF0182 family)
MSAPTYHTNSRGGGWLIVAAVVVLLLIVGARTAASWVLDYYWWKEMGQLSTWANMLIYGVAPVVGAAIIAFIVFWTAHARALKAAGTGLGRHPTYARLSTLGILLLAIFFAVAVVDSWAVVRYFGGSGVASPEGAWRDPVYGQPLTFYLFTLPFYRVLLGFLLGLTFITALIYWLAARAWTIRAQLPKIGPTGSLDLGDLRLFGGLESRFLNIAVSLFLVALAIRLYLGRYGMLMNNHGFMVGMDWVDENIALPLLWLTIAACFAAAALFWIGLRRWAAAMAVVLVIQIFVPRIVAAVYVRPNELTIERPYIQRHIEATRSAFRLNQRAWETDFTTRQESIDVAAHRPLLDNVRLWDWRAFHDTVSQIQPLRPFVFSDTDVDRYTLAGQLRQVLLSPRELDLNQLGDARNRWINPHFVYTHGYGVVVAEANRITPNGLPVLLIKDAPPVISAPGLKLTRPELYYGEGTHEPVFVSTDQPEFNYPSGSDNVHTRYEGQGGFPVSSLNRLAAAVYYGDPNIVLTAQMSPRSRMMIHRNITDRLNTLAGFVRWDSDPYLVLTNDGRQVWIVDGYLTSSAHPYSAAVQLTGGESVNYTRNSVKAVVDAYDGTARLYVFDPSDPLVRAYENLFPALFTPESAMPADIRAHVRYPELLFRIQAEIYRTFHMRDAEAFYNKADLWDIARTVQSQEATPQPMTPTYVVATMPNEQTPEFMLILPFTPRNKDNLIGMMVARCDGPHLGELVFLQLSKQDIVLGPMQIEARINQDQVIAKDLTLWNQQGSQVLRGQMIVLPIGNTFLYVEPIYIQARDARMPQLKKVVLASGDTLIYTDTYQQALEQLANAAPGATPETESQTTTAAPPPPAATPAATPAVDNRLQAIRDHLRRYRDLTAQGRMAEAGKELEAIESLTR